MKNSRTVEFASCGLNAQVSEAEWPKGLPLPREPNVPRGSRVIEMPNINHKGLVRTPIGEYYLCSKTSYRWELADYV